MKHVVVTGASRGLGAEFVRQFLARGDRVTAWARDPGASAALRSLACDRLATSACDVGDDASVAAATAALDGGIDLLVNNAGVAGRTGAGLAELDWQDMRAVFETNVLGVLRTTRALLPALRRGASPAVASLTSRMGSIADNGSGGWWAYRCSKAALNMANANLALELRGLGIPAIVLHPGWVRTDMGGAGAPLSTEESVAGMVQVVDGVDMRSTGGFFDHQGEPVPW